MSNRWSNCLVCEEHRIYIAQLNCRSVSLRSYSKTGVDIAAHHLQHRNDTSDTSSSPLIWYLHERIVQALQLAFFVLPSWFSVGGRTQVIVEDRHPSAHLTSSDRN